MQVVCVCQSRLLVQQIKWCVFGVQQIKWCVFVWEEQAVGAAG